MHRTPSGSLTFSPQDLVAYLEGDFAAWCERFVVEHARGGAGVAGDAAAGIAPDVDEERELAARKGQEYEDRYLAALRAREPGLVEIGRGENALALTLEAMQSGAPAIYQAHLVAGSWQGYPDFLFRVPGDSMLGDWHYVPWDTKLARSTRPYFLVQLCTYAELLESIQGRRPEELVFVLGNGEERRFPTPDYFYYYLRLKRAFLDFQDRWDAGRMPEPGLDRSWGRWNSMAERLLAESDHLGMVAGITRVQVGRLEEAGVETLTRLAEGSLPRVPGIQPAVLERLALQATLQVDSRDAGRPLWRFRTLPADEPRRGLALLPPASPLDVFFDMEGFPFAEHGLEYLFGAVTAETGRPVFHDWWAHDPVEERRALEQFIDWVMDRWRRDPSLHIYHYASYEPSAVGRLMGRYATREAEVDQLLRHEVFVDLYQVVRQGLVIGTPSYSLKEVERLVVGARKGDVVTAAGSVIAYQRWLDAGEPRDWRQSPILKAIREYNRVDCDSTRQLCEWLLDRQRQRGLAFLPPPFADELPPAGAPAPARTAAEELADRLLRRAETERRSDPERGRVTELLAWLTDFHRREEKPMWWRMFARHELTAEGLYDDPDCLADLVRTPTLVRAIKHSQGLEYRFDPDQDTRLRAGSRCYLAGTRDKCEIVSLDGERGLVELKVGPGKALPERLHLIADEYVSAETIKEAVLRVAAAWESGTVLSSAVDDLLFRRPPRIEGHGGGPLLPGGASLPQVIELTTRLHRTTLCIQGPPGTGKTFTAAAIILELLRRGKRIGVTANSHKVILNLMKAVVRARGTARLAARLYKVGEGADDPLVEQGEIALLESREVAGALSGGPVLVGGTAWVFSRPELTGRFDYLFVDEAGQVALANAVAVGPSAANLVLVGDQMQLSQPMQGTHPGETGRSVLDYVLQDHATVPTDRGVFLGTSYRMTGRVCDFISEAIYEGRLGSAPETAAHRVVAGVPGGRIQAETGIVWVPVAHSGCGQSSDEEVEVIGGIVEELLGRHVVDRHGGPRRMRLEDILLVAPFNMQVRRLRHRLGETARIGSVDRFQGQEAPVVIVSLCASSLDEAPRGAAFLLEPNRLNVAVSRAEALAVVVGSPQLLAARCRSVEEMKLVNLLCRLVHYAEGSAG